MCECFPCCLNVRVTPALPLLQCLSGWREQWSLGAGRTGKSTFISLATCCLSTGRLPATTISRLHRRQPSSSCSFDGSLKADQSDCESKWPEVPPVLNQNEDRKRNKYLRKDYLKVWHDPDWWSHFCEQTKQTAWLTSHGRVSKIMQEKLRKVSQLVRRNPKGGRAASFD